MKNLDDNWQTWGLGTKPHGLQGACSLRPLLLEKYLPKQGDEILLVPEGKRNDLPKNGKKYIVERVIVGHKIMVWFQGIEQRDQILAILPFRLMLPKEVCRDFQKDQKNLLGFTALDGEGNNVGMVESMDHNGVQNILEIRGKKNFALPLVDGFIKEIDVKKKYIIVVVPTYV